MKTQLHKAILPFCLAVALCVNSQAQIVYTDIVPDTTINANGSSYSLDLNNDGIADFNIQYSTAQVTAYCAGSHTSTAIYIKISPFGSNGIGHIGTNTYPGSLLANAVIDSTAFTWVNSPNQILSEKLWRCIPIMGSHWQAYYLGTWNNASSKYLPLRLYVGTQVFYGWLRLSIPYGTSSFTVQDYAYDSSATHSIITGEQLPAVTSLEEPSLEHTSIYSAGKKLYINRKDGIYPEETLVVFNMLGQELRRVKLLKQVTEIELNEYNSGIYLVTLQSTDGIVTIKIVLE